MSRPVISDALNLLRNGFYHACLNVMMYKYFTHGKECISDTDHVSLGNTCT